MLQPQFTMQGYNWPEQRSIDEIGFVRAIRSLLTSHLPILLPTVHYAIASDFDEQIEQSSSLEGYVDVKQLPVFSATKNAVTRVNSIVFFGEELGT